MVRQQLLQRFAFLRRGIWPSNRRGPLGRTGTYIPVHTCDTKAAVGHYCPDFQFKNQGKKFRRVALRC